MDIEILARRGWSKVGALSYRHYCGAEVAKYGALWTARAVDGVSSTGHGTAAEAIEYLEKNDTLFWTYGEWASMGGLDIGGELSVTTGYLDEEKKRHVFVCFLEEQTAISKSLASLFGKHFFGKATCVRCSSPISSLRTLFLCEFSGAKRYRNAYIVCACDYPVWSIEQRAFLKAEISLRKAQYSAENSKRRRERIRENGGKHSWGELREILALQDYRCFYCHREFNNERSWTRDHIDPVTYGGADWPLNIVMACRRCNIRRGTIPFRTYCKLLSPTQNRRILRQLQQRLMALDFDHLPDGALNTFHVGLARHNPRDHRYLDLQRSSRRVSEYAARNRLLPRYAHLILKRA